MYFLHHAILLTGLILSSNFVVIGFLLYSKLLTMSWKVKIKKKTVGNNYYLTKRVRQSIWIKGTLTKPGKKQLLGRLKRKDKLPLSRNCIAMECDFVSLAHNWRTSYIVIVGCCSHKKYSFLYVVHLFSCIPKDFLKYSWMDYFLWCCHPRKTFYIIHSTYTS